MKGEKIWILCMESCVDGEIFFEVKPFASLESAQVLLKDKVEDIFKEIIHFKVFADFGKEELAEYCSIEKDDNRYFIKDLFDDYYEEYYIVEKEIN